MVGDKRRILLRNSALRTAIIYTLIAFLWIIITDYFLFYFIPLEKVTYYQTIKGIVFVLLSGWLIFFLISRYSSHDDFSNDYYLEPKSKRYLYLLFSAFFLLSIIILSIGKILYDKMRSDIVDHEKSEAVECSVLAMRDLDKTFKKLRLEYFALLNTQLNRDYINSKTASDQIATIESSINDIMKSYIVSGVKLLSKQYKPLYEKGFSSNLLESKLKQDTVDGVIFYYDIIPSDTSILENVVIPIYDSNDLGLTGYLVVTLNLREYLTKWYQLFNNKLTLTLVSTLYKEENKFVVINPLLYNGIQSVNITPVENALQTSDWGILSENRELSGIITKVKNIEFNGSQYYLVLASVLDSPIYTLVELEEEKIVRANIVHQLLIGSLVFLVIFIVGVGIGLLWRQERARMYYKQYQLEKEKAALIEHYRYIVENARDVLLLLDDKGRIVEYSPSLERIFMYNKDELGGFSIYDLISREDMEKFNTELVKDPDANIFCEISCVRKDGTKFPAGVTISAPMDNPSGYRSVVIRDITMRKEREKQLMIAKQKAEEAEKMKTNFLANMSHEMRTPLTAITGFAEVLRESIEDEGQKELVDYVLIGSKRLTDTLNLILSFTELEHKMLVVQESKFNLCEIVTEVSNIFSKLIRDKNIDFDVEITNPNITLTSDERMIAVILYELLGNALKFTDKGSIKIMVYQEDNQCTVKIKDTGIGIEKDKLDIIFQPFRQSSEGLSRKYEGVGLGLTIAKNYAELLGGKLTVESIPNAGAEFTLTFKINNAELEGEIKDNPEKI